MIATIILFSSLVSQEASPSIMVELVYEPIVCITDPCPQFVGGDPKEGYHLENLDPAAVGLKPHQKIVVKGAATGKNPTIVKVAEWYSPVGNFVPSNSTQQGKDSVESKPNEPKP